ncbi:hypothetical protein NDU88_001425 [Pleurodeles waltl]|uniref:Uncharacterized protein n=1 Tax=Pleurodeles waltl TaxID=8319 RepID=A0AAV7R9U7_PLEWA|nr:hypothetical protein NDU88_001425 [Pleurodeles waltl]
MEVGSGAGGHVSAASDVAERRGTTCLTDVAGVACPRVDEVGPVLFLAVPVLSRPDSDEEKQKAGGLTGHPPFSLGVQRGLPEGCTNESEGTRIEERDMCAGPRLRWGRR